MKHSSRPTSPLRLVILLIVIVGLLGALVVVSGSLAQMLGLDVSWLLTGALAIVVVGAAVGVRAKYARAQTLVTRNQEALALLNSGKVAEAAAIFDDLIAKSGSLKSYRALFTLNRGVAWLHQGDPERALSMVEPILRAGWYTKELRTAYGPGVAATALAQALSGDIDGALATLERHGGLVPQAQQGALLIARGVVLGRTGRHVELLETLDAGWDGAEALLPVRSIRLLHALRAVGLVGTGAEASLVAAALERAGSAAREDFRYVSSQWPELEGVLSGGHREPTDVVH